MARAVIALLACGAVQAQTQKLAIVNIRLHQFEDGPPVAAGHDFLPGEMIALSFQVAGFKSEKEHIRLGFTVDALDGQGTRIAPTHSGKIEAELLPEDKEWLPKARHSVVIPPHAESGVHEFRIVVTDEVAGTQASAKAEFEIRGRRVEPSEMLVVRNLSFFRKEDDTEPLEIAAFRAGDAVWARFDITGFRSGEKNRLEVEYGVALVSATGEAILTQPSAAVEKDEPFYRRRWVPGAIGLTLGRDFQAGEYTIILTLRDHVGNQTAESRHNFRVE